MRTFVRLSITEAALLAAGRSPQSILLPAASCSAWSETPRPMFR